MWFHHVEKQEHDMPWNRLKQCCMLRFGPSRGINYLGELSNLKQNHGPIEEHIDNFQTLAAHTTDVRYDHLVDLFTASLDELIRLDVEGQRPQDLDEAMNLVCTFAHKYTLDWGMHSPGFSLLASRSTVRPESNKPITANSSVNKPNNQSSQSSTPSSPAPFIEQLSRREYVERRERGQCFNCDERYTPTYLCKRIFCLLLDDDVDEE